MLWWHLGVPKEPGLILIFYTSYDRFIVHGPNICVVLWCALYLSHLQTPCINLIHWRNPFIPGEGSAESWQYLVIKGTPRERNFHRTWWELSRAKIFAFLLQSAPDKKERKGGRKQWKKQRKKVSKRFLGWKVTIASETTSWQTCLQVSCLLLPSGLETLNFPSLGPQFWFNPENEQETD